MWLSSSAILDVYKMKCFCVSFKSNLIWCQVLIHQACHEVTGGCLFPGVPQRSKGSNMKWVLSEVPLVFSREFGFSPSQALEINHLRGLWSILGHKNVAPELGGPGLGLSFLGLPCSPSSLPAQYSQWAQVYLKKEKLSSSTEFICLPHYLLGIGEGKNI